MKHFNKIFAIVLLAGIAGTASAQNFKFGHINASELIMLMPDRDSAQVKLEAYGKDLQEQVEALQVEFNNKLNTYKSKEATWTAAILEQKQREIQELGQRVEDFQKTAAEDFQKMQGTLLRPVIEKANAAVSKVGKANGFTYIFDTSTGSIPYFNPEQSIDVLPLVRTELKIPADKKVPAMAAGTATR